MEDYLSFRNRINEEFAKKLEEDKKSSPKYDPNDIFYYIVGNKIDMDLDLFMKNREVHKEEA